MSRRNRALVAILTKIPRPLVWRFAKNYIAGPTLDDGLRVVRDLNGKGCRATMDVLGEDVFEESEVRAYVDAYRDMIRRIVAEGLDANISVKPTAMGLKMSRELALEAVGEVLDEAARHGMFVRLDMEDSSVTGATLDLWRELRRRGYDEVGVVLQSYLRRTLDDARRLAAEGASVRLCKGIYIEPRAVAYDDPWTIRDSFVDALEVLLRAEGTRVGIATHDEWLVFHGRRLVRELGIEKDRYEFQMLLGVDEFLRDLLVAEGHPMRIYVPFGEGWHGYSIRRLVENPRLAAHITRAVLGLGPRQR